VALVTANGTCLQGNLTRPCFLLDHPCYLIENLGYPDWGACCLGSNERQIRATADLLFDTVNTETNCCGCKDQVLSKTETMLLLSVLQDESRGMLLPHRGMIMMIVAELRNKMSESSEGGREITRDELRKSILDATSIYQREAIEAIAAELQRDYAMLESGAPPDLAMDRGMAPGAGHARLIP